MAKQYLTAVFELRPTRRKAAALERVRAQAESVFWTVLSEERDRADALAAVAESKERRTAWRTAQNDLARRIMVAGVKAGLCESVIQGLARDVAMAIGSYVELRAGGHEAEWPTPVLARDTDHAAALDLFATASTREHENAARDALALVLRRPGPRPLTIARERDARIVRTGLHGGIAVVVNVLRASDPLTRPATLQPGIDAATGEAMKGGATRTKLIIPLSCSKWHEQKFLSGRTILRSSLIRRAGERWFMCAQFEFPVRVIRPTGARLGVDRGIVNPVAMATVDRTGAVQASIPPAGAEIGQIIARADERRRREQKRRGITSHRHNNAVDHQLQLLANSIVTEAKQRGAQVVLEMLDGFKQTIVAPRPKGDRKGGWRRSLKRAQLAKLEAILTYKLSLAGLPKARDVVAGGTSITCPACGLRDPKSRAAQDRFACTSCGFTAHADTVGAVNIARRGVVMEKITKGAKLAPLEQDMVARLRLRDDGGLGPLGAQVFAASGFVAARATAAGAYDPQGLTSTAGRNIQPTSVQNAGDGVFAERSAHFSAHRKGAKASALSVGSSRIGFRSPENAG